MGIVNRTKDVSEQRVVLGEIFGATATGVTGIIGHVPYPATLESGQIAAFGLSGAPNYTITINRFIAGAGATAIVVGTGTSNTPSAFGTSGVAATGASGLVMVWGSTLMSLLPNDVIMFTSGVANTAVTGLAISLVIKPVQDIKVHFGLV
jgi:hypothetical protein